MKISQSDFILEPAMLEHVVEICDLVNLAYRKKDTKT